LFKTILKLALTLFRQFLVTLQISLGGFDFE
jgi:hypothetical protein